MDRGNVLVIGNSGVGKSTLINAVLGKECAEVGYGSVGTTKELYSYNNDSLPFNIIDSAGFEPSLIGKYKAIYAIKKWSSKSVKEGYQDKQINVIWFCIDGTSRKLFPDVIKNLSSAISIWKSVPVIVVITKSYSIPEREENIEMVNKVFAKQRRYSKNLKKIIPVVASIYVLNDSAYAAPDGITELIEETNRLLPDGVKAAEKDIYNYILKRKQVFAHSIVSVLAATGATFGAVPIPFADAVVLNSIELVEINTLARLYGINKLENSKPFLNSIVEVGTVSAVAKTAVSALKSIPVVNLAAGAINAIIAGCFVFAIGEGAIYAFEQVYIGKKTVEDIDWVKKIIESKLSVELIDKAKLIAEKVTDKTTHDNIGTIISEVFNVTSK